MNFEGAKTYILKRMEAELPDYLHYHSIFHVLDVYQSAEKLAESEKISPAETLLLLTAVLFHDSGFIIGGKNHEELSCEIARNDLPGFGYSGSDIERVCQLIMATRIPQNPKNHIEEIICDADLDYLGRDDFWKIGELLFEEYERLGIVATKQEWNQMQIRFLGAHQYFTQSARSNRNAKKLEHLLALKSIVAQDL